MAENPWTKRKPRRTNHTGTNDRIVRGLILIAFVAGAFFVAHALGGSNPNTPPGHAGYLFHQPLVFGKREFVGTQLGPSSTGWRWRVGVSNIDIRTQTWSETSQIFSTDNLEVTFDAHARISIRKGTVRKIVEKYSGESWYQNNVRMPYKTAVREEVRNFTAFGIKDNSKQIATKILKRLRKEYKDTPFIFHSISIGNIDYPKNVAARVQANLATEQRRQRMEIEERIAVAEARIREIKAKGEAEAQEIEQATLTPIFVQHEAAELYRDLAGEGDSESKANVVVVIPTRPDRAGVPQIYGGR